MFRGVVIGALAAGLLATCACMQEPVKAEPLTDPKPVIVPYTGMTVEQFQKVTEYRKAQLSEEDATFTETCTNTLEAVGTFEPTYVEPEPELIDLGAWTITAYCSCPECTGIYASGYTASGTLATEGRTVASNELPIGSRIIIDGHEYIVEDTGYSPYSPWIDIYFESHEAALAWGVQEREVFLIND